MMSAARTGCQSPWSGTTYLSFVFLFVGYDTAYPAAGVFHVTLVPGDHVDMQMRNGLACRFADIDTDIVTIRMVLLVYDGFHFIDQRPDGHFLFCSCLEVFANVPVGNHQAMTRIDRVAVEMSERQAVFDNDFGVAAKGTIMMFGHDNGFLVRVLITRFPVVKSR